tara:strand:- start:3466 stop:4920 length:1455 start_codon:yes stop_codon:yes gene_type:complete
MVEVSPLIARRRRISSSAFTGRANPSAVSPSEIRSQRLLNTNSMQLAAVSGEIRSLSIQVNQLSSSLEGVRTSFATQQALERQKEQQERILENRAAQQKLREGKESVIEQKIKAAALRPVIRLGQKAQSSLTSLSSFLFRLAGGWLLARGVDALIALGQGNQKRLNEIKDMVLTGVAGYVATTGAIKLALGLIVGGFSKLNLILTGISLVYLFREPIINFVNLLVEKGKEFVRSLITEASNRLKIPIPTPGFLQPGPLINFGGGNNNQTSQQGQTQQSNPFPLVKTVKPSEPEPAPQNMALGGMVEGPAGVDKVPANLTAGEFVMPVNVVNTYGEGFMESIRSMEMPGGNIFNYTFDTGDALEKAFRKKTALREALPENQIGAKVSDPEILAMIVQENEVGRTGNLPSAVQPIFNDRKPIVDRISQEIPSEQINVVPMPMSGGSSAEPQEVDSSSGNIAPVPSYASGDPDDPFGVSNVSIYGIL